MENEENLGQTDFLCFSRASQGSINRSALLFTFSRTSYKRFRLVSHEDEILGDESPPFDFWRKEQDDFGLEVFAIT